MKFTKNKININFQSSYLKDYAEEILYKGKENIFFSEERLIKVLKSIDNMLIKLNNEGYDLTLDDEKNIVLYVGKLCNLIIHNNYDMIEERDFFKLLEVTYIELLIYEYSKMKNTYDLYHLKSFYNIFNNRFDQMNSESTYNIDRWINIIEKIIVSCSRAENSKRELDICIFNRFVEFAIKLRIYYVSDNAYIASLEKYFFNDPSLRLLASDVKRQNEYLELVQKETGVYNYESDYQKINGNDIAFGLKELERYNKLLDETKQKMKALEKEINAIEKNSSEYENSFNKLKMDLLSNTKKELIQIFDNQLSSISDTATKESKNIQDEVFTIKKDMLDIFNKKTIEINKEWKLINQMLSMISKELTNKLLRQETVVSQNSNEKINEKNNITNNFSDVQQIIYSEPIFYLRNDIPLKERLELLYQQKDSTKLYHKKFDQVVKSVLNNDIVYLVGPSGSGKTTLAQQIAQTLNLPLYNIGYVVDEFLQIRGVMDANSNFIESLFYHAFKGGGICFFDEFDASESKALIELNKIFGSGEFQPYTFANGETVKANPNFRIITAGNTWGDGLTFANNTRGKLDDATMNRCTMYEVYYDEQLEKGIMDKYPDIYEALITLRHYYEETDSPYVITTRDMFEFAQKLDTECFDLDEIIVTKILKNKRSDTVEKMSEALENSGCDDFAHRLRKCKKL